MIENMNKLYLISAGTHVANACNNFPEFCTNPRMKTQQHRCLCTLAWNGNNFRIANRPTHMALVLQSDLLIAPGNL